MSIVTPESLTLLYREFVESVRTSVLSDDDSDFIASYNKGNELYTTFLYGNVPYTTLEALDREVSEHLFDLIIHARDILKTTTTTHAGKIMMIKVAERIF